jgi:hypothetical protein
MAHAMLVGAHAAAAAVASQGVTRQALPPHLLWFMLIAVTPSAEGALHTTSQEVLLNRTTRRRWWRRQRRWRWRYWQHGRLRLRHRLAHLLPGSPGQHDGAALDRAAPSRG